MSFQQSVEWICLFQKTIHEPHPNCPMPPLFPSCAPQSRCFWYIQKKNTPGPANCTTIWFRVQNNTFTGSKSRLRAFSFFFFRQNLKLIYSLANTYWCMVPQKYLLTYKWTVCQGIDCREKFSHSAPVWVWFYISLVEKLAQDFRGNQ